ncbi:reverse transcriptase [Caerostris extrusa]|uniref:Reverse transcriptase n=1 Tax=Caerostris extrusa TaxID=172846 RepID=A0AAV4QG02_CAEEX|nr:reverse transcriptase [Caerostris extrusa]
MFSTLFVSRKHGREEIAATDHPPRISRFLFIKDKRFNISFLIDIGSGNSLIPAVQRKTPIPKFTAFLSKFPAITRPPCADYPVKPSILHYIETLGPPVFVKPRRLAFDRLQITKTEIQHMLDLGHTRPSKSNYASPLHDKKERQF